MTTAKLTFTSLLVVPLLFTPSVLATQLQMPLEELVSRAEQIAIVTVTESRCFYDTYPVRRDPDDPSTEFERRQLTTSYVLSVEQVLKGDESTHAMEVKRRGGIDGTRIERWSEEYFLDFGAKYLVMAKKAPKGRPMWVIPFAGQGVFRVLEGGVLTHSLSTDEAPPPEEEKISIDEINKLIRGQEQ